MPSYRIGFGSDFSLNNSNVGIGTTLGRKKLDVVGVSKGDFNITGVSTLTVYGGFVGQKQNISVASTIGFSTSGVGTFVQVTESETGYLSLVGEYNTVSEDIIVDEGKIFEVSVGSTVSPGTLESVSIQSHFNVPNGGINDRPDQPTEGMVRFNDDLNTLEFYNGIEWRQFTVSGASGRGVFGGGNTPTVTSTISYVNISTEGNATNFGNLTVARDAPASCSNSIRGLFGGGWVAPVGKNEIDYITIASEGNAADFGDLTNSRGFLASCSSSTRGIWMGGYPLVNIIDYVEISTLGNALDFGDMGSVVESNGGLSSPTRGISAGGMSPGATSFIEFITISSKGNALIFGNLTEKKRNLSGCSNSVRGVFGGGLDNPTNITVLNTIEYIIIASTGNAQDFGDLSLARRGPSSTSTSIRGIFGGGITPTTSNAIDYITIASTGNAQDFGDLTVAVNTSSACSDSHGGLGGF